MLFQYVWFMQFEKKCQTPAYIMAYHADNSIPATIEEWLDQFDMFSIYEVLPQILELWGDNIATDVQAKKGLAEVSGK